MSGHFMPLAIRDQQRVHQQTATDWHAARAATERARQVELEAYTAMCEAGRQLADLIAKETAA